MLACEDRSPDASETCWMPEDVSYAALSTYAGSRLRTVGELCQAVGILMPANSLMDSLGLFVLDYFRAAATEESHMLAGHGPDGVRSAGFTLH